jgi:hypothetical protein
MDFDESTQSDKTPCRERPGTQVAHIVCGNLGVPEIPFFEAIVFKITKINKEIFNSPNHR